jgi:hypothetical protein
VNQSVEFCHFLGSRYLRYGTEFLPELPKKNMLKDPILDAERARLLASIPKTGKYDLVVGDTIKLAARRC